MVRRRRESLLPTNLIQLQNLIKRDPSSYEEDFNNQWQHYLNTRALFKLQSVVDRPSNFIELLDFLSQVSNHYPKVTQTFVDDLAQLLEECEDNEVLEKAVSCLVLLRKKNSVSFLRTQAYKTIVSEIRLANAHHKQPGLNKYLQSLLFGLLDDNSSGSAIWAVRICKELWKRKVWTDARTVDIMRIAALHNNPRIVVAANCFFIGDKVGSEGDHTDSEEEKSYDHTSSRMQLAKLKHQIGINGKTKKSEKQLRRVMSSLKRRENAKNVRQDRDLNFPAIYLLHDPQSLVEALFSKHLLRTSALKHEHKLEVLKFVSRLTGLHKLQLEGYFSWLQKYLTPRQADVTHYLVAVAQASHEFITPETLEPLVRKIANEFVTGGVSNQVVQAGINSIREICLRQPNVMNETLLQDLAEYKSSRDKGIMMASRSLIGLYRGLNPSLLRKKDRGRDASVDPLVLTSKYGEEKGVKKGFEGLELLAQWKRKIGMENDNDDKNDKDDGWQNWEVESDSGSDNDSAGWMSVSSDDRDIIISDEDTINILSKGKVNAISLTKSVRFADQIPTVEADQDVLNLVTNDLLTPADLAKLRELQLKHNIESALDHKVKKWTPNNNYVESGTVSVDNILGPRKKAKADYEERLSSIQEGREGREKYAGSASKFKTKGGHSTTNTDKAKNKNWLMVKSKRSIQGKAGRSLHLKQKQLRAEKSRQSKLKRH